MFSKSKLEEILKKSPPKPKNPRMTLQEKWSEYMELLIKKGYDKDEALELAKANAESFDLKMPKDSTFKTWWSTKSAKVKSDAKKSRVDTPVPTAEVDSAGEPIPKKIRQRIREEMEADGWMHMGAGLTIYIKSPDVEGRMFPVWTGRNPPGTEPGTWVIQSFEKWTDAKDGDPTFS